MKKRTLGIFLLLLTAFIWGLAFIAQRTGAESIDPFTFSTTRMLLGGFALFPILIIIDIKRLKGTNHKEKAKPKKAVQKTIISGVILGIVFCIACNFQQFALEYSSAGKVAFITAFYILLVPIFSLVLKHKVPAISWLGSGLGLVGLFLLCVNVSDLTSFNLGDLLALFGALLFAIHILLVEKYASEVDGLKLSCIQLLVGGIISLPLMFIFESPSWVAISSAIVPILYAGICSCGIAYTLQIIGQRYVEPSLATLVMSMESVFAVVLASIILKEAMSVSETIGCVVMLIAIVTPQIWEIAKSKKKI